MKQLLFFLFLVPFLVHAEDRWDKFKVTSRDSNGVEQEYFTGYVRDPQQYHRAQYRDFRIKAGAHGAEPLPKEIDLRPFVQHVRKQQCGDCWAQGSTQAMEIGVSHVMKASIFASVQSVIDCSNMGSCGGGGSSLGFYLKGAMYESDYPYKGSNGRCKSDTPRHEAAKTVYFLRPATPENLHRAYFEGATVEFCGASRSLANGGWVTKPISGGEDHCYAGIGYLDGASHGKPDGTYNGIQNSWGESWGADKGKGYYRQVSETEFGGNAFNEIQVAMLEPACTPQPVADGGPDRNIILQGE